MRRSGPKPHSAEVIELTGNRSKLSAAEIEARRAGEVQARPLRPTPPAHLSPYARDCWDQHAPELEHLGLLTVLDAASFELTCEVYAVAREALEQMRPRRADGGADQRTNRREVVDVDRVHGGMLKKHPAFAAFIIASNAYRGWCQEFGLTPSARVSLRPASRPGAGEGTGPEDGDEDDFFGT